MPVHGEIRVVMRAIKIPVMVKSPIAGAPPQKGYKEGKVQMLQQFFGIECTNAAGQYYPDQGTWKDVPIVNEEAKTEEKEAEKPSAA